LEKQNAISRNEFCDPNNKFAIEDVITAKHKMLHFKILWFGRCNCIELLCSSLISCACCLWPWALRNFPDSIVSNIMVFYRSDFIWSKNIACRLKPRKKGLLMWFFLTMACLYFSIIFCRYFHLTRYFGTWPYIGKSIICIFFLKIWVFYSLLISHKINFIRQRKEL
jgi:hypothetical protein